MSISNNFNIPHLSTGDILRNKLLQKDITDHDRYILNHKLDALKELGV